MGWLIFPLMVAVGWVIGWYLTDVIDWWRHR